MTNDSNTLPSPTRRTKIVCTLGPASRSRDTIRRLVGAGMNVARVNCSHGTHDEHAETVAGVRAVAAELGVTIPVLLDLSGPKMRIGSIAGGYADLDVGGEYTLTTREIEGTADGVSIDYPELIDDLNEGDRILMGDGEIELRVVSTTDTDARCEVVVGGELRSRKGINAPGVKLRGTVPTKKDLDDAKFGLSQGVDWFALSFVRSAEEIERLRSVVAEAGTPIVAKIEKREALDCIGDILATADGVMVARGDLGLEFPIEDVPLVQKDLIRAALGAGKPVITATQMLESMMTNPRPTRAEAADIANAVFDGTDAVMLSGETAAGRYPVEAVRTMASIAKASEGRIDYTSRFKSRIHDHELGIAEAVSHAACHTAVVTRARVIICCTRSGQTARYVSNYRPDAKIAVVSPSEETLRRAMLYWNTHPIAIELFPNTDSMIEAAKAAVLAAGIAERGDRVVVVAGVPVNVPGTTNMIKADTL
jgi:pyruvate kinase